VPSAGNTSYSEWVTHLTRGELLDLVLDVEVRLRRLIRAMFGSQQLDWDHLIPDRIRKALISTQTSSVRRGDLLDFATLKQLIDIVLHDWPLFAPLINDQQEFQVRTRDFRRWRNSLAHGEYLSEEDKFEIVITVRQVGKQIPMVPSPEPPRSPDGSSAAGSVVLWVDDHPEWSFGEREILTSLGIRVLPALTNDEAVQLANKQSFDLVISDIERDDEESGERLPTLLNAVGIETPFLFYVARVDQTRPLPAGARGITNDPAILIRDTLALLTEC
jgi:CheY-like chemotaxis protein